jgi:hypothetical protein
MNLLYEEKYRVEYPLGLETFEGIRYNRKDGVFSDSTEH